MFGDFSRSSFDRAKDFSLVRMQQGRVFTDADWNEQGDILRTADRAAIADIIGHAGFPQDDPGFGLTLANPSGALLIGPGTGYVAGVRHELRVYSEMKVERQSGAGAQTVWRITQGELLADGDTLSAGPANAPTFHVVSDFAQAEDGTRTFKTVRAMPNGTTAVRKVATLLRQPFAEMDALPPDNDEYLAFLKSMDVTVTALDDPAIREVAFDGPDTATRDRTIWHVILYRRTVLLQRSLTAADLTCAALAGGIDPELGTHSRGLLRARAEAAAANDGPCTLPPSAGYRSLENRLYRVEIHNGGAPAEATYKWSPENAIHRTWYRTVDGPVLVVDSVGRDEQTALKAEDWVEIRDRGSILGERPGFFARIGEVIGNRITLAEILDPATLQPLTDAGEPDVDALPREAEVTRWEGGSPLPVAPVVGAWSELENGVEIGFDDGRFQTGDYWTVPARSVTGNIEWPSHPVTGEPVAKMPEGPRRDYAALARLTRDNAGWSVVEDCRPFFPAAVKSIQVLYAGGDGQEALPDPLALATRVPLPEPLRVAVLRGHMPIAGASVRFEIAEGDGLFGNGQASEVAATNAEGIAEVTWNLDATTIAQQVRAARLDSAGDPSHTPIFFSATLSRADVTSFDPANTPPLAGANTVQEAIEALAGMQQIGCATHIITPQQDWVAILEGLKPGENAAICFAPGSYTAVRPVVMKGLGHISIHGAAQDVAEISVDRSESALAFESCAMVTIHNLTIKALAGASGVDPQNRSHRRGTLDFTQCVDIEVFDCDIQCGAGTSAERSCITSRGWLAELGKLVPANSIRIRGNFLSVGHMQEAVVISDAIDIDVSGNSISVRSRKAQSLPLDAFIKDKVWLSSTVSGLVARPAKGKTLTRTPGKVIRGNEWRVSFSSPLPQDAWDTLVNDNPPSAAELASLDTFQAYAKKVVAIASRDAGKFPSIKTQLDGLQRTLGLPADAFKKPEVLSNILVTSEPEAFRFDGRTGNERNVLLEANGEVVSFDSAFSQEDWSRALGRIPGAAKITNSDQLLVVARQMAKLMIVDPKFRQGMGSVSNWLARFTDNSPSLAKQGIVCGGRRLDNVRIADNLIRGCQVGVRVAPSHRRDQRYDTRSVLIQNNRMELLKADPELYAGYGLFVGNALTVRILGNDIALQYPKSGGFFAQGIRIWGFVGRQVLLSQNRIAIATMGIRLHHVEEEVAASLWVFNQNLIEGPKGVRGYKVTPTGVFRDVDNLVVATL